jgi:hypothetical protein
MSATGNAHAWDEPTGEQFADIERVEDIFVWSPARRDRDCQPLAALRAA